MSAIPKIGEPLPLKISCFFSPPALAGCAGDDGVAPVSLVQGLVSGAPGGVHILKMLPTQLIIVYN
jgi:hypothetical protein